MVCLGCSSWSPNSTRRFLDCIVCCSCSWPFDEQLPRNSDSTTTIMILLFAEGKSTITIGKTAINNASIGRTGAPKLLKLSIHFGILSCWGTCHSVKASLGAQPSWCQRTDTIGFSFGNLPTEVELDLAGWIGFPLWRLARKRWNTRQAAYFSRFLVPVITTEQRREFLVLSIRRRRISVK